MNITLPCVEVITSSACVLPLLDIEIEGTEDWDSDEYGDRKASCHWISAFYPESITILDQEGNARPEFLETVNQWIDENEETILEAAEEVAAKDARETLLESMKRGHAAR